MWVSTVTSASAKAIIQSVLLYGSETWAVTPQMLKILDSFHHHIARRITNTMPKRISDGEHLLRRLLVVLASIPLIIISAPNRILWQFMLLIALSTPFVNKLTKTLVLQALALVLALGGGLKHQLVNLRWKSLPWTPPRLLPLNYLLPRHSLLLQRPLHHKLQQST